MKKTIIILLIFLIFITLNFANLKDFYENYLGKISYEKGEFESAEKYFQNSENKKSVYNLAKTFYKQKKYKPSAEKFESLLDNEKSILNFSVKSNLGNVYFKIGELEKTKENWEKSIEFYRQALKIKYDEKVEKNLQFVLDKLNKLKKEENNGKNSESSLEGQEEKTGSGKSEDKNGEQKNNSESNLEGQEKENNGKNSESSLEGQEEKTGSGKSENKSGEQKNDSESSSEGQEKGKYELTDEQKVELKKYQDNLKKSELQNSDSFGKVYTENNDFSNFDSIFNDPFFDDPFGERKTEKKDW